MQSNPTFVYSMVTYLGNNLAAIARAMPPAVDLTPVVNAINHQTTFFDVPNSIAQQIAHDAMMPPQYVAAMQGTAGDVADAVLGVLKWIYDPDPAGTVKDKEPPAMSPSTRSAIGWVRDILAGLMREAPNWEKDFKDWLTPVLKNAMSNVISAEDAVFAPIVKNLVGAVTKFLKPAGGAVPALGMPGGDFDGPVAAATGVTLTTEFMAWLLSFIGINTGPALKHVVELIAAAVDFEELRDVLIGPLVREGIGAAATLNARAQFQQHTPGVGAVADWLARQLVPAGEANQLAAFDGINAHLFALMTTAAQKGINPRQLIQLLPTGLLSAADLTDELNFSGMRQASQHRMQLAAPYLASRAQRDALRSTLEAAYAAGLLADQDLQSQLDGIENVVDRDQLAISNAKWKKLIAITKQLENEYSTLYIGGVIDDATFRSDLTAIGLQQDVASAVAAVAEAKANAALVKRNIAEARALGRATQAEERRAAMKSFVTGQITVAALTAELLAAGLTPIQTAAWVELAQLQKGGGLKWLYGRQLSPGDATLLRQRVAALTDQRKRLQIDDPTYHQQLVALGIPDVWVNALRAAADAMITPKTSAFAIPVQGS